MEHSNRCGSDRSQSFSQHPILEKLERAYGFPTLFVRVKPYVADVYYLLRLQWAGPFALADCEACGADLLSV